jgi:hypothetical protein
LREILVSLGAAGRSIRHDPNAVSARALAAYQVEHVAEKSANGGTQYMQDVEAAGRWSIGRQASRDAGRSAVFTLC